LNKKLIYLQIFIIVVFIGLALELIPKPKIDKQRRFTIPTIEEAKPTALPGELHLRIIAPGKLNLPEVDPDQNGVITDQTFEEYRLDSGKSWIATSGGLSWVKKYLQLTQESFAPKFITVVPGIEIEEGSPIEKINQDWGQILSLFNAIAVDTENASLAKYPIGLPWVASNIYNSAQIGLKAIDNVLPYVIIEQNGLRVLVLSFVEAAEKGLKINPMAFHRDMASSLLQIRQELGKYSADLTVVLLKGDGFCLSPIANSTIAFNDLKKNKIECNKTRGPIQLLKRLIPGSVDLIVTTDPYNAVGIIDDTVILQIGDQGRYIGMVDFYFDQVSKKMIRNRTRVLPFVKTCHYFLPLTDDCAPSENLNQIGRFPVGHKQQEKPSLFLGKKLLH